MIYTRKIYPLLKKHLHVPQVTVITGMRRVGKTTLVKQLLSDAGTNNIYYFDLERLDNRELFSEKNYENIFNAFIRLGLTHKKRIIIALDEIQMAASIVSAIKYLYDHHAIKFIVTGSSSYYLKNLFRESLAGRKKIFEINPLDFGEYLTFHGKSYRQLPLDDIIFESLEYERLKSDYEDYIRYGGFPEVVLAKDIAHKRDLLFDIISSYMSIDIKTLADVRDERALYQLIKMLASRIGTRLDYSKLSRLTGLSRPTVTSYVDLLEKTYLIRRLPVHSANIDRQIVKAQKIYFTDNGIVNILTELGSGVQFENMVNHQLAQRGLLSYWADKTGHEVDFIVDQTTGIETKESPTLDDLHQLKRLCKTLDIKIQFLVGRNPSATFRNFIWGGSIQ